MSFSSTLHLPAPFYKDDAVRRLAPMVAHLGADQQDVAVAALVPLISGLAVTDGVGELLGVTPGAGAAAGTGPHFQRALEFEIAQRFAQGVAGHAVAGQRGHELLPRLGDFAHALRVGPQGVVDTIHYFLARGIGLTLPYQAAVKK